MTSAHSSHGVVGIGNDNNILDMELPTVTNVIFALTVSNEGTSSRLIGEAQLRNRR